MRSRRRQGAEWRGVRVAVLAVLAVLLPGCAPLTDLTAPAVANRVSDERPVREGGTLTVALDEDPDKLDPTLASTFVGRTVFAAMCEKLYDVDENLDLVPQLAAALPEVSPDGLTVTIAVREGLRFSDGTVLDAQAVKTSLDRHRTLDGSSRSGELQSVESVDVLDPRTVRLTLSAPYQALPGVLADRSGMVMSPAALAELGADFSRQPSCVGPFRFVERVAGNRIVVERDPNYYDADAVQLDRVVFTIIPDPNVRLANLRSGDIDVSSEVAPTDIAALLTEKDLQLFSSPSLGYQGITVNIGNVAGIGEPVGTAPGALASDVRIREAFELSLDREVINEVVYAGLYEPACGPIPPNSPYSSPAVQQCPGRDLPRARQLLREAGARTPVPVELVVKNSSDTIRLGQVIQAMAKDAGFAVTLRPTEFATALEEGDAGRFEAFQVGWSGRIDPDNNVADWVQTGAPQNIGGISDPVIDDLVERSRSTAGVEQRRDLYAQLVARVREQHGLIYLYRPRNYVGARRAVGGLEVFSDGIVRVTKAGFVE